MYNLLGVIGVQHFFLLLPVDFEILLNQVLSQF
jgi:hypothetical protein